MDPIDVPASLFIADWMKTLLQDEAEHVKLLDSFGRKFLWSMCQALGVENSGVAGQACRLTERYIAARIREADHLPTGGMQWMCFKLVLASRLPLVIAITIQLSAKMASSAVLLRPNFVQATLILKGATYSIEDILATEFEVFKTLQFRVPLWTSVDAAKMLATDVGMPPALLTGLALVVNLTEFYRARLEADVRMTVAMPSNARNRVRTVHMVAGAVVASGKYLNFRGLDPILKLAKLTRAPCYYIKCIADLVLQYLSEDDAKEQPIVSRKRKIMS